ncbi:MAG: ATP-binding protein [Kiritimatiellae bacterium]|nr:ATP-binding protein [Kiritimatiellia bacterium]
MLSKGLIVLFQRKIYEKLLEWKNRSHGETALLIEGARRVGKSTVVEEFGRREYKSVAVIDFMRPNRKVVSAILEHPDDLDVLFTEISLGYKVELHTRDTLIVFDEVQRCPQARELIKALVADGRYDYIETGSLISIRMNTEDITIPSEEESIGMYPMDFEEFLWAMGDTVTFPLIRRAYEERRAMGRSFHNTAMHRFREYLMVGGMPQAVAKYRETRNFGEADRVKRTILKLYRDDIAKFAKRGAAKVRRVFDGIPGQLTKKEKKFSLASLGRNARRRTYEDAFLWLADAKVANIAYNATDPSVALALSEDDSTCKVYAADTGLMIAQSLGDRPFTEGAIYGEVYSGNLGVNEGMVMENYVAQALAANGRRLFFYSRYDLENSENRMEVDFLIRRGDKICPVEVKSGANLSHASLDKFRKKFGKSIGEAFLLCTKDVAEHEGVVYLPLYMASFL